MPLLHYFADDGSMASTEVTPAQWRALETLVKAGKKLENITVNKQVIPFNKVIGLDYPEKKERPQWGKKMPDQPKKKPLAKGELPPHVQKLKDMGLNTDWYLQSKHHK